MQCTILQNVQPPPRLSQRLYRPVFETTVHDPDDAGGSSLAIYRGAMDYAGDLTPREAWELLARSPGAVLVDVRSEAEWAFVGLPDMTELGKKLVMIPWNHWPGGRNERFLDDLVDAGVTGGEPVLFICRSGARSRAAAVAATQAGIAPAYNVSEGFEGDLDEAGHRGVNGWRAIGLPWRQS